MIKVGEINMLFSGFFTHLIIPDMHSIPDLGTPTWAVFHKISISSPNKSGICQVEARGKQNAERLPNNWATFGDIGR
jgi:hypothetical protein